MRQQILTSLADQELPFGSSSWFWVELATREALGRGQRGDPEGDHTHACPLNSGTRTRRHTHILNTMRRLLPWLGIAAQAEVEDPWLLHRPDIGTSGFNLPLTYLEVHMAHPAIHGRQWASVFA